MNKTIQNNIEIAESYYKNMLEKNFDDMAACLHEDVRFISPFADISDKARLVESAKKVSDILSNVQIREKFSSDNTAMLAYDFTFTNPAIKLRTAVLMEFKNNLISKIELFYDGRPFEIKK